MEPRSFGKILDFVNVCGMIVMMMIAIVCRAVQYHHHTVLSIQQLYMCDHSIVFLFYEHWMSVGCGQPKVSPLHPFWEF